jgi:chlorobactene glucosyltransferase
MPAPGKSRCARIARRRPGTPAALRHCTSAAHAQAARAVLVVHALILALLLLSLAGVLANLARFDSLATAPPPVEAPLVSIMVPARNEARNIEACVRSLLAQDYPRCQLIVLDDRSEDGTGDLIRALGLSEESGSRTLLRGQELPEGWAGKNWACHQLVQLARGEFLFFTDADTVHAPGTMSAAVAYAREKRADLVSAWPRLLTGTPGEALIIPMILLLGMTLYPHWFVLWLQDRPRLAARLPARLLRSLGAANGQFLLFTRAAYERLGGHQALRDHLVEDVAFGRAVTARMGEGMRLFNCEALRFSTVRMYRSLAETWEGFTKNMWPAFEGKIVAFLVIGAAQFGCFLFPFFALFGPAKWRAFAVAEVVLIYIIRVILTARFRTSWLGAVLHPLGHALCLAIGLNSWRCSAGGGVTWKGRQYKVARTS